MENVALTQVSWTPSREAGLLRFRAFLPHCGMPYAQSRNYDRGVGDRSNISALSPWIRRRLVTEEEIIKEVLSTHSLRNAQKFIEEILWRSYWKGWLEMRPFVLSRYEAEKGALISQCLQESGLSKKYEQAVNGETGITCMDDWVNELRTYGYLHNHARMWFASIWIFTLKLPWQLGAHLFFENLLDADEASNTLSWRWVAGLHTKGKHYQASAHNISTFTNGRYNPEGELNESTTYIQEDAAIEEMIPITKSERVVGEKAVLLLTTEDLHPESITFNTHIVAVGGLEFPVIPTQNRVALQFLDGALSDGLLRASNYFGAEVSTFKVTAEDAYSLSRNRFHRVCQQLATWAKNCGTQDIVTPYAPLGEVAQSIKAISNILEEYGIRLVRIHRSFDSKLWPYATSGFFKFKEKALKQLLRE
jgi:deoxyribodipyrimidine photo-lyase